MPPYRDRRHAGEVLARALEGGIRPDTLILAVPNGGIAVAVPIAQALHLPLFPMIIRKIQIPWNTEAGFGAVGSDGTVLLNEPLIRELGLTDREIQIQTEKARKSVRDRLRRYLAGKSPPVLTDRPLVLIDDGLASGITMETAVRLVSKHRPQHVVVAAPTASLSAIRRIRPLVDTLVCPDIRREPVFAVADAYECWRDLRDEEVLDLLSRSGLAPGSGSNPSGAPSHLRSAHPGNRTRFPPEIKQPGLEARAAMNPQGRG